MYKTLNDWVVLCDDNGRQLYELKMKLTVETANYRKSIVDYELYIDLYNQLTRYSPSSVHSLTAEAFIKNANNSRVIMCESLDKVRTIEESIRIIKPDFSSPISHIAFPRVG